ncbi:MAG: nucleotidyl transferase AbiEii/AbiGii toxin family protein [Solirubrobacterales bacterium]|nr:nucleotidyl transferase AbiEii/AbiGii toxin family protein [Solirubrobacterales bacterium]
MAADPLPKELREVLPAEAQKAWGLLAPILPPPLYLGGGTGVAVHLKHRESRDLDFFFHRNAVDLEQLAEQVDAAGPFAVTAIAPGTLRGVLGATKLEFLHADEATAQKRLEEPTVVGGLRVAGLKDLIAMKLKVLGERGEMRDYFDVRAIDEQSPLSVEDGIALFLERYRLEPSSEAVRSLVRAMGYLDDVEEDEALPISKDELAAWWRRRQASVIRSLGRTDLG